MSNIKLGISMKEDEKEYSDVIFAYEHHNKRVIVVPKADNDNSTIWVHEAS